jgi:spore coat polysaccharide biosynthesis protein SpsF
VIIGATIEVRMGSTRLPGKALAPVLGKAMLEILIERLRRVPSLDKVVVATTVNPADDAIAALAGRLGVSCFRGSEDDVLGRVLGAAAANGIDLVVQTTGDNPVLDPAVIEACIKDFLAGDADYVASNLKATWPDGMDVAVFPRRLLEESAAATQDQSDREHVTQYIKRSGRYRLRNLPAPAEFHQPDLVLTLDTADDLAVLTALVEAVMPAAPAFGLTEICAFFAAHPEIKAINAEVARKYVREA